RAGPVPVGCTLIASNVLPPSDLIVLATPAQTTRAVLGRFVDQIPPNAPLMITAKGIEQDSLYLQSSVIDDVLPAHPVAVLTGPSFAKDVQAGQPTALTLAMPDARRGGLLRDALSGNGIRLYSTTDMVGAQIGGALKNVIAIACGIVAGRGLGTSAQAAIMTRGFAELSRLGLAMGAELETMTGLSGLGDLTLTCHSPTSRNFSYGFALGHTGQPPHQGTFEGAKTAAAAVALGARHTVDMPISTVIRNVIAEQCSIDNAIQSLLNRPLKPE
ncbi:MAG: NAD(P)H-dependent glycerol-3-phosphate dehydrogenase, partial [Pseudomonadota bacterium]